MENGCVQVAVSRMCTSIGTSGTAQEKTSCLYRAAGERLSCTEQHFSLRAALWDPKTQTATKDTQGKVKLRLGTVLALSTCKPRLMISLKMP